VHLGSRSVEVTDNMGHTGLVSHDSGEMNRLLGVILWEGLDFATMTSSTLSWEETQRTMTGRFKLTVTHLEES